MRRWRAYDEQGTSVGHGPEDEAPPEGARVVWDEVPDGWVPPCKMRDLGEVEEAE